VSERAQRLALWLNQSLVLSTEIQVAEGGQDAGRLEIWLRGLRDQRIHCIEANATGRIRIGTEDPVFAGDVVQSLAVYLGLRELGSEANFPAEEKRMLDALEKFKGSMHWDGAPLVFPSPQLHLSAKNTPTLFANVVLNH
jgi:Bardet-Biedl syndrome 2 protein